jgi:hypothetical protein
MFARTRLEVWDEGHAIGQTHPSKSTPRFRDTSGHCFRGAGVNFSRADLVDSMPNYRGLDSVSMGDC